MAIEISGLRSLQRLAGGGQGRAAGEGGGAGGGVTVRRVVLRSGSGGSGARAQATEGAAALRKAGERLGSGKLGGMLAALGPKVGDQLQRALRAAGVGEGRNGGGADGPARGGGGARRTGTADGAGDGNGRGPGAAGGGIGPLQEGNVRAADKPALEAAYRTAMKTEEGRRVIQAASSQDLPISVVDSLPDRGSNVIGNWQGTRGESGRIRLRSDAIRNPEAGAALLVHELRHALPGGDEAASERSEALVKEQLRGG